MRRLASVCFLFLSGLAVAQAPGPQAIRLGVADGLSQGSVYAVAQDARGFLWFGTHDGLDRYDGYELRAYRRGAGGVGTLAHNRIHGLVPEPDGALWVLSATGLDRLDPMTGRFVRWGTVEGSGALARRDAGGVWVGTGDGLLVARPERPGLRRVTRDSLVRAVLDDGAGRVWLGTSRGLHVVDVRTGRSEELRGLPVGLRQPVVALLRGRDGSLWAGTASALFRRRAEATGFEQVHGVDGGGALVEDPDGNVWAGGAHGVRCVDASSGAVAPLRVDDAVVDDYVQSITVDRDGLMWIGTDPGGVLRVDLTARPPLFSPLEVGLEPDDVVTALDEGPGGRVWVGTLRGGLHWADAGLHGTRDGLGEAVRAIHEDADGTLWVGTEGGLASIAPDGRVQTHDLAFGGERRSAVYVLAPGRGGTLWVGTHLGLYRRYRGETFERIGVGETRAVLEARDGAVWIGSYGMGLYRLHGGSPPEAVGDGMDRAAVLALVEDRRGRIWAGTDDGLYAVDPTTGHTERYDETDGLSSAFVYSLAEDLGGALWMGTNRGVVRFDPLARRVRFHAFTAADGVRSVELSHGAALGTRHGEMLFGGQGVDRIRQGEWDGEALGPPVVFTAFSLYDERVDPGVDLNGDAPVRLRPDDAVVTLSFAGLAFADPARTRYAYRMDGVDSDWVEAGTRREARYTHLAPGTYTFRVHAAGADAWGPVRALTLVVPPPWWRTWWALTLLGGTALATVVGGTRAAVGRRLRRQLREAEARRATDVALARDRARIADDVHDHVGATLTEIQLLSEAVRRGGGSDGAALDRISRAARAATEDLDAIVWAVDPARDMPEAFADYLCRVAEDFCESAGLRCRLDLPDLWPDLRLPAEARHAAFLVVREALCNVAKHGEARTVYLTLAAGTESVQIEIEDDGRGFDPAASISGNGLRTMAARAARASGRLAVDAARGRGTRVRLTLPARTESG